MPSNDTFEDCQSKCKNNNRCGAFTHSNASGSDQCWLKQYPQGKINLRRNSRYTVYVKDEIEDDLVCFTIPKMIRGRERKGVLCVPNKYKGVEEEIAEKEFKLALEKAEEEEEEEPWYW